MSLKMITEVVDVDGVVVTVSESAVDGVEERVEVDEVAGNSWLTVGKSWLEEHVDVGKMLKSIVEKLVSVGMVELELELMLISKE